MLEWSEREEAQEKANILWSACYMTLIRFGICALVRVILLANIASSSLHDEYSERHLISHLLSHYKTYGRPVKNHTTIINVTIQLQLYSLVEVSWKDEFLVWTPEDWADIQKVNIPASMIWMPDGYIFNTVDMKEPLTQLNARVRHDGHVEVDFNKLVDLRCPMDVLPFPFDEQLCSLQFGSWSYGTSQLHHVVKPSSIPDLNNTEWEILDFTSEAVTKSYEGSTGEVNEYEEIFFRLKIRRKPLYYIVVILIPTFVIVNVSIIGIFTPHGVAGDREEKVSLGLTTLLTMAVILDMISAEMPKSAAGVPLLGRFILAETVVCVFAISLSVICIFLHERMLYTSQEVPCSLSLLTRKVRRFSQNCELERPLLPIQFEQLRDILQDIRAFNEDMKRGEQHKVDWQRIFSLVDISAMIFFLVVNFFITLKMFSSAYF